MSKPDIPIEDQPWIKRNIPFVTFFSRASTWYVLIIAVALQFAIHWKRALWWTQLPGLPDGTQGEWIPVTLYDFMGAWLTIPTLGMSIFFMSMLSIHLLFRQTVDKDTHDGTYVCDWTSLSSTDRMRFTIWIRVGFFIGFCILCASLAKGAEPDQVMRWNNSRINPSFSIALDLAVQTYKANAARYQAITNMRQTGVPAVIIACLHARESGSNFRCHPHEGSPLTGRTRSVPKGRLPLPANPPFTFEQSAADAYYVCDRLDLVRWMDLQAALQGMESFNGLGYQKYHPGVPSPYLWSGTTTYRRGKYTGDGRFDAYAVDKQLGCAAILMRLREAGFPLPWEVAAK